MGSEIVERLEARQRRANREADFGAMPDRLFSQAAARITALEAEIELLADNGCHLQAQLAALEAMCEKMAGALELYQRLLMPIQMKLGYLELAGEKAGDDATLFSFSGGGGSDWTTVGDLRKADDAARETLAQYREADNGR